MGITVQDSHSDNDVKSWLLFVYPAHATCLFLSFLFFDADLGFSSVLFCVSKAGEGRGEGGMRCFFLIESFSLLDTRLWGNRFWGQGHGAEHEATKINRGRYAAGEY